MKTIYSFIVIVLVFGFTSCTSADNNIVEQTSLFESVRSAYGVENVTYSIIGLTIFHQFQQKICVMFSRLCVRTAILNTIVYVPRRMVMRKWSCPATIRLLPVAV